MAARHKSVETKYMEDRDAVLRGVRRLDRRTFLKVLGASAGAVMAKGLMPPHTFQLVNVAEAAVDKSASATGAPGTPPFTFAYISDTHMYVRTQREWLKGDLAKVPATTPLLIFSHSPLYKYYRNWNFWTEDAEQVQALLDPARRHLCQLSASRLQGLGRQRPTSSSPTASAFFTTLRRSAAL